jgi:hypothetical protein
MKPKDTRNIEGGNKEKDTAPELHLTNREKKQNKEEFFACRRDDSCPIPRARVAELADALDLGLKN